MRDGGQLVDVGVGKILSAHSSFGNRSRSRIPVIFPLKTTFDNYTYEKVKALRLHLSLNTNPFWTFLYSPVSLSFCVFFFDFLIEI